MYEKYQDFLSENFQFLVVKFSVYLNRRVYVMEIMQEHTLRNIPAGTGRLYNVGSTSMQRHDVASTLRRRCINVMCPLG